MPDQAGMGRLRTVMAVGLARLLRMGGRRRGMLSNFIGAIWYL